MQEEIVEMLFDRICWRKKAESKRVAKPHVITKKYLCSEQLSFDREEILQDSI